jgi:glycosyltransferase involved in cell wall biosynthesis
MISDLRTSRAVKGVFRLLDRFTLYTADRVVAISEYGRQTFLAEGFSVSHLVCIYNGVDVDRFNPEVVPSPNIQNWKNDSFTIGMFAQMTVVKRHDLLIRVLAKAVTEGRDWRVVLAGDGPLRDRLEDLAARLGISDRVLFLGFVQDTPPAYGACDVITLPSDREGFPTTILEAMACGKPVVASDTGGVRELLDNLGIVVKENTVEDLFSGLARLEDVRLRQTMGRAGRRLVTDKFGIDNMIRRYEELYLSCFPNLK